MSIKRSITVFLAVLTALVSCGCMGMIHEDSVYEDLPAIDPEEGVERSVSVKLYYRLTNESELVGVTRNITVRAGERVENAIVRTLIAGVPPLSNNVSALFSGDTTVESTTIDGEIVYITLSSGFLSESILEQATAENESLLENGYIDQAKYDVAIENAKEAMLLVRRLGVYSIVNTLTEYSGSQIRVQILVDTGDNGAGTRLDRAMLGLPEIENADSMLIEPMSFVENVTATPETIVISALNRLVIDEYENAYPLFADSESGGYQRPAYADYETELKSIGVITGFNTYGYELSDDLSMATVTADIMYTDPYSVQSVMENAKIMLNREGDLYKLGYFSFLGLFGVEAE